MTLWDTIRWGKEENKDCAKYFFKYGTDGDKQLITESRLLNFLKIIPPVTVSIDS